MYLVSQEITDLKSEFEGGNALSVDWYALLRRGMDKMLGQIYPETLKRTVALYGGFTRDAHVYYCPTDVLVPSRIYINDEDVVQDRPFRYRPSKAFFARNEERTFTVIYINKVRFVVLRHDQNPAFLTIDSMDDYTAISGTATSIAQNTHNFISGSGAVQAVFTDAGLDIGASFATAEDITAYLRGTLIVPAYFASAVKVASVAFRFLTSTGNYFEVTSTADSIGDSFKDGLNLIRFDMANRTSTGTPDETSIASWQLIITATTGESITVIVDKITLQATKFANFEYYSNNGFIDGSDGSWKETPVSGDYINLDRDSRAILHYEVCRLTGRQPITGVDFGQELAREYEQYGRQHPSSAELLSYNIMPNVNGGSDLPDRIGDNLPQGWSPIDYTV